LVKDKGVCKRICISLFLFRANLYNANQFIIANFNLIYIRLLDHIMRNKILYVKIDKRRLILWIE
jgi:hypothetical protein